MVDGVLRHIYSWRNDSIWVKRLIVASAISLDVESVQFIVDSLFRVITAGTAVSERVVQFIGSFEPPAIKAQVEVSCCSTICSFQDSSGLIGDLVRVCSFIGDLVCVWFYQ